MLENGKTNYLALSQLKSVSKDKLRSENLNEFERKLVTIWQKILPNFSGDIHISFFNAGGTSLQALNLISLIYIEFNAQIPLDILFTHQTISALAEYLSSSQVKNVASSLVSISPKVELTSMFLLHPVGGNIVCYQDFVELLKDHFSLYGFRSVGLHNHSATINNMSEIAKKYIEELTHVNKSGSAVLMGWSMGSLIAFEMALQLESQGRTVPLLVLIDPKIISSTYLAEDKNNAILLSHLLEMVYSGSDQVKLSTPLRLFNTLKLVAGMRSLVEKKSVEDFLTSLPKRASELTREKLLPYLTLLKHDILNTNDAQLPIYEVTTLMKKYHFIDESVDAQYFKNFYEVFRANSHASLNYQPRPFSGKVLLFKSQTQIDISIDQFDWKPYCQEIEVVNLPCSHYDVLKNNYAMRIMMKKIMENLNG